jgi:hypothetical protein
LSNYELGVTPLRANFALRLCRKLILSEEWLATGRFEITQKIAKEKGLRETSDLKWILMRQCMDLAGAPETAHFASGVLFSRAFDENLARVFEERLRRFFHFVGIPSSAWEDSDPELGADILSVLVDRFRRILMNEALARGTSPPRAAAAYLGFLIRMALFGYLKCRGDRTDVSDLVPIGLFTDPDRPILAFKSDEELRAEREFTSVPVGVRARDRKSN